MHSRTLRASFRLCMSNTLKVQSTSTHVHYVYRSGCPCSTLYRYKYKHSRTLRAPFKLSMPNIVQLQVQAPTHTTCIVQTVQHRTSTSTVCTSTHAGSRTINTPLKRPMPSTVQVHVRCACFTPFTCNGHTAQAAHDRCTAQMAHAKHYASTQTCTSARQVLGSCMPSAAHARTHVLTRIGIPLALHMPTAVHAHIHAHMYKGAPLGLHMPSAVPYARPRKMRLTSSSIHYDRTAPHIEHTVMHPIRRTPYRTHIRVKCGAQAPILT